MATRRPTRQPKVASGASSARSNASADTSKPSAAQRLPHELLVVIFAHALRAPPSLSDSEATASTGKGKGKDVSHPSPSWMLLLLSKSLRSSLESHFYSRVSLTTITALQKFARTLKARPDLARKVKALWIAPISIESDFVLALKPPSDSIADVPSQLSQPLSDIRQILRSCRSLRHAALDGCLCTLQASNSFGSNCQPVSLVSINPYSFLGGFSTPMFRKVRRLEMCDTSLASEEVEQVRSLPDLCHFIWTSPREYSDAKRDVLAMLRILTPRVPPSHLQLSIGGVRHFSDTAADESTQPFPVKAQTHRHLRSITIRTGQSRSAELAASLQSAVEEHSLKLAQHTAHVLAQQKQSREGGYEISSSTGNEEEEEDLAESFSSALTLNSTRNLPSLQSRGAGTLPYIDSSAHTSSILHPSTGIMLQTCKFSSSVAGAEDDDDDEDEAIIDEWEHLRDLICGSGSVAAVEDYKRQQRERARKSGMQPDEAEDEREEEYREIVPGMALRRLWVEWCRRVENGDLEVSEEEFHTGPLKV